MHFLEMSTVNDWQELMGEDLIFKVSGQLNDTSSNESKVPEVGDALRISFEARVLGSDITCASRLKLIPVGEKNTPYLSQEKWLITLGDGDVPAALEMGARFLCERQNGIVRCHSKYAHGKIGRKITSSCIAVPPASCVEFRIRLDEVVSSNEFTRSFNLERAQWKKNLAKEMYFSNQEYLIAFKLYKSAADIACSLLSEEDDSELNYIEEKNIIKQLLIDCFNNISLCHIKMKDFSKAKASCTAVLEIDQNNIKAFTRAILCCVELGSYEEAQRLLEVAEGIDPKSPDIQKMAQIFRRKRQEYKVKEKEMYIKMMNYGKDFKFSKREISSQEKKIDQESLPLQDIELSLSNPKFITLVLSLLIVLLSSVYLKFSVEEFKGN